MSTLLPLLLACAPPTGSADATDTAVDDTAVPVGETIRLYGETLDARGFGPLAGARIESLDRPGEGTESAADGRWEMDIAARDWVVLRTTAGDRIPVEAFIDPLEADDPDSLYGYTLGTFADLTALAATIGAPPPRRGTAVLFVDAIAPDASDVLDARVTIDADHSGPFRQTADDAWDTEPLTTEDRSDLLFLDVTPGLVNIEVVGPFGNPCVGPPEIPLQADVAAQVSFYCPERNRSDDPGD